MHECPFYGLPFFGSKVKLTARRGPSVPRPAVGGAMLTLLRRTILTELTAANWPPASSWQCPKSRTCRCLRFIRCSFAEVAEKENPPLWAGLPLLQSSHPCCTALSCWCAGTRRSSDIGRSFLFLCIPGAKPPWGAAGRALETCLGRKCHSVGRVLPVRNWKFSYGIVC